MTVKNENEEMSGQIDPRKPEEAGHQIPLSHVGLAPFAATELDKGPHRYKEVAHQKERPDRDGKLHPGFAGAVAPQNAQHSDQDSEIPHMSGRQDNSDRTTLFTRKPCHEPDDKPEGRLASPPINESIYMGWINPSVIEKFATRKEPRVM